ncbi:MAG: ATP-binding protein [Candidatus Riflebacteria bacterium]|nr:ATP-binding protein [Candidatus Riflebacteria bacterium]
MPIQETSSLKLIHAKCPRNVALDDNHHLFIETQTLSGKTTGGDHFSGCVFQESLSSSGLTILSLSNCSDNETECRLHGIITDLINGSPSFAHLGSGIVDIITRLNKLITRLNERINESRTSGFETIFTNLTLEIDHATRLLHVVAVGHPAFLLIRGNEVFRVPKQCGKINDLHPVAKPDTALVVQDLQLRLQPRDRILLFTDAFLERFSDSEDQSSDTESLQQLIANIITAQPEMRVSELIHRLITVAGESEYKNAEQAPNYAISGNVNMIGLELETWTQPLVERIIPRDLDHFELALNALTSRISAEWGKCGLTDAVRRVRFTIEETAMNAWKHGHKYNSQLPIEFRWWQGNDFHFQVSDQGLGFRLDEILNPTTPPNLLLEHGRGIFLMHLMADSITWNQSGNQILVSFRRNFS